MTSFVNQANGESQAADGAFDVGKIKGKLGKRPPKGVGAAKKEKAAKDKQADGKKPKAKASAKPQLA